MLSNYTKMAYDRCEAIYHLTRPFLDLAVEAVHGMEVHESILTVSDRVGLKWCF